MRTTLDLPEELLADAMRISHARTKRMAVALGLQELINRYRIEHLRSLRGKIDLDINIRKSRKR